MKTNCSSHQIRSAVIIQRCFRSYLKGKIKTETELSKCESSLLNEKDELVKKYILTRNSLKLFYKKMGQNCDKIESVHTLINSSDMLSNFLLSLNDLEQCIFPNRNSTVSSETLLKAKHGHESKMHQYNLQWWEKLEDIQDTSSNRSNR